MSLREYGLPTLGKPKGKPKWVITDPPIECPNCGAVVCYIQVEMEPDKDQPMTALVKGVLQGDRMIALYLGCPACPWASQAAFTRLDNIKENERLI